jgi:hypothetical protein
MHLAPRFSVAEGRDQRLQLRACSFHVLVIQGFDYPCEPQRAEGESKGFILQPSAKELDFDSRW